MIVGRDDEDARQAVTLAAAVGITEVAGYLAGGMTSWREEKRPVERTTRVTGTRLALARRAPGKTDTSPARSTSTNHDIRHLPEGIDPDQPVAVVCGSGQRAAVGASLLQRHGASGVIHVVEGGVPHWQRQGWPVDSPGTTET